MENYWLSLGAIRAKVENGRVVDVKPFELDKYPTEMINGIKGLIYSESRIRYPMVRLDWLKNKEKSDRTSRGDNRFVRVTWDEALRSLLRRTRTHSAKLWSLGITYR